MLPLGLKILLGKVENPPVSRVSKSKRQATIADWLEFNDLTCEIVLRQLALLEPLDGYAFDRSEVQPHLELTTDEAWALCAESMRVAFPDLKSGIDQIEVEAPKCLQPKSTKHPKPFTYDLGFLNLPFVSLHYKDRPADLLAMAHEFGHALQIVAAWESGEGQMPPVARETCAFLGEWAVIHHSQVQFPLLTSTHHRDDINYLGNKAQELKTAIQDGRAPYSYGWNYPIARLTARCVFCAPHQAIRLFKSGKNGGQVFIELIGQSLEKEVAA